MTPEIVLIILAVAILAVLKIVVKVADKVLGLAGLVVIGYLVACYLGYAELPDQVTTAVAWFHFITSAAPVR